MPHALLARFRAARVIPVVRTRSAQTAAMAVGWLRDAGIRIFEINMTVPDGVAPIRDLASDPDAILDYYSRLGPAVGVLKMGEAGAYLGAREPRR